MKIAFTYRLPLKTRNNIVSHSASWTEEEEEEQQCLLLIVKTIFI